MPNSEGISLSKDYYTSTSDDGEIYPEGHPRYSAPNYGDAKPQTNANTAENDGNGGADNANGAENVGNSGQKATVGDVVKAVAGVVGDAIDTTEMTTENLMPTLSRKISRTLKSEWKALK